MKCIVCANEIPTEDLKDVADREMCSQCWFEFRYAKYPDEHYKNFEKINDEYDYIGMYPNYERRIL